MKKTAKTLTVALLVLALLTSALAMTASAAETVVAWKDTDNDGIQDSGEATYTNLSTALSAGGTVKLTADYTLGDNATAEQYISMSSGTATLDLNGHTLICASLIKEEIIVLSGSADLTITDSKTTGVFRCESRIKVILSDSSKLTFAGGIIQTNTVYTQYYLTINKSGNAVFQITGGKHYSNPTEYVAANHKVTIGDTDPKYTVSAIETNEVVAWNDADNDGVIDSGEQVFSDMDTALAAGVDLKMNSDIFRNSRSSPPGSLKITSTKTIDLNGYSIVASAYCFEVTGGTLTVKDSAGGGQIWCQDDEKYAAITVSYGENIGLTVESGTILGSIAHYGASRYPNAVVLSGGNYNFDPSEYIKDSTLTAGQDSSGLWGIRPKAENACSVTIGGEYFYTGEAITPTIVVTDLSNSEILTEGVDYTVSLAENVSIGTAKATVTFINDYRGSITETFAIGCDHSYSEHTTATNNGNGTHNFTCTVCGNIGSEQHTFTTDTCICGAQAPVMFTTAGETPVVAYYMSLDEAIQNTLLHPGATVMLLADVTLSEVITVNTDEENDTYNFVLDLNGKTIDNPNGGVFALSSQYGSAVNMRITDSSQEKAGRIIGNGMVITISARGDLAIDSVTIISGTIDNSNPSGYAIYKVDAVNSWSDNATVEISSGTFIGTVTASTGDVTGGSFTRISSEYLAKYHYAYDENGDIITYTSEKSLENCTVKKGADIAHIYTYLPNSTPYTGVPYNPVLRVSMCTDGLEEGTHYTVVVKNNEAVGTATFTFTGIAPFSGSFTKTVNITKGTLKVDTAPSATYSFGDDYTKAAIAGKVVVNGNTSLEIPGTWSWVDSTTAVFTPEAQYQDQFEALAAQTVAITVTPTTPVITLETPSPSILPGMSIQMTAVAKNPYNDTLTDLPTVFKLTYKVGENGAETTVDGLKFTLPSDATMGQTVYVWVTTEAVSGKYTAGQSDTIELLVGQVDYSQMLDDLTDRLEALEAEFGPDGEIEKIKADIQALKDDLDGCATDAELAEAVSTINTKISGLQTQINTIVDTYATKAELSAAIEELKTGDIATIQAAIVKINGILGTIADGTTVADELTELADALSALTDRVTANEGNIADNASTITALQGNLATLQTTVSGLPTMDVTNALRDSITGLANELNTLIGRVTQAESDIDKLEQAVEDLKTLIQTNSDDIGKIEEQIATINETIEKMKSDYATDAEVAAAIEKARQELSAEAQKFLADAETKLTEAFNKKADAATLEENVKQLQAAIDLAKQFATDSDTALQAAIEAADGKLMQAIDQVQENLDAAQKELQDAIDTKADADEIAAALENLTKAVESAKGIAAAGDAALRKELAESEEALQQAIDALAQRLSDAQRSLSASIAAGKAANAKQIRELEAALSAAIAANAAADEETKAELALLIREAREDLQAAIDQVVADLAAAQQALNKAIAAGDKNLDDKITALNAALENAIAASNAADEALTAEMNKAVAALEKAIAQVQKNLDSTKAELIAKDSAMEAELERINEMVIIVCVVALVALCGCMALLTVVIIDKQKRAN